MNPIGIPTSAAEIAMATAAPAAINVQVSRSDRAVTKKTAHE
jgi:hypothetical protein